MERKTGIKTLIMVSLLLISVLMSGVNIRPAKASGTIYIKADGSIDPPTAPILHVGDTYVFADNINDQIFVSRNDAIIDGSGRTMHGHGNGTAIALNETVGVTVKNVRVESFGNGIVLAGCSGCNVSENSVTTIHYYGIRLSGSTHVAMSRNNVTGTSADGVFLDVSSYNSVYDNNFKGSACAGVRLWKSTHNIFCRNNMVNNLDGMFFDTSLDNIVRQNNVSANKYSGIYLQGWYGPYLYENNTFSLNDFVGNAGAGMVFEGCSGNTVWHNNFDSGPPQVDLCPDCGVRSRNTYDDGYSSGGNYWSDYNGTDLYSGPFQNVTGSDGIGDTPYVIDSDNIDHYPFMKPNGWENPFSLETNVTIADETIRGTALYFTVSGPTGHEGYVNATMPVGFNTTAIKVSVDMNPVQQPFPIVTTNGTHYFIYFEFTLSAHEIVIRFGPLHDVAVANVMSSKTVVGEGCSLIVNVVLANRGGSTETFNVTTYANTNLIETQTVKNLLCGTSAVLSFLWNITGIPKGNHTISAYAWPVSGETNTANNNCTGGWVIVAMVGDITGRNGVPDGRVDMYDVGLFAAAFDSKPGDRRWNPNCDITGRKGVPDNRVDMYDVGLLASMFGKHDP